MSDAGQKPVNTTETVAVIPAFNNASSIHSTVTSVLRSGLTTRVIVVDDSSTDATSQQAAAAGATVVRLSKNLGKGGALQAGMDQARGAGVLLMVDGDLGESAIAADRLIAEVQAGRADMAIGVLPPAGKSGGLGLVKRFAGWLILKKSGFRAAAPLSGQRAMRYEVFEACRPLAAGFAVDSALTIDAVRRGFRVVELPVEMTHDHRGRTVAGFRHRARQGLHLLTGLVLSRRR